MFPTNLRVLSLSTKKQTPIPTMFSTVLISALLAEGVRGYAFVARMPGVDSSLLGRAPQLEARQQPGSAASCPFNPNHTDAGKTITYVDGTPPLTALHSTHQLQVPILRCYWRRSWVSDLLKQPCSSQGRFRTCIRATRKE